MDVATANAVPRDCSLPDEKVSPSPPDSRTTPVVSENTEPLDEFDVELLTGSRRNTGRVAWEDRNTHFHSSLISAPRDGPEDTMSMLLNRVARLIWSRFSEPAATAILRRMAGKKLASVTRIEYRSGVN